MTHNKANSMKKNQNSFLLLLVAFFVCVAGCGESAPELVPFAAVVKTAEGEPVSHLKLRMIPQDNSLDGNFIATGVTGEDGKCVLTLPGRDDSAIPACLHKVLVVEAPESNEARQAYMAGDPTAIEKELSERKNGRPISKKYSTLQNTPLSVEVSADKPELEIVLE